MHVVMKVLSSDGWVRRGCLFCYHIVALILEVGGVLCKTLLQLLAVVVLKCVLLHVRDHVVVLLFLILLICDGLDRGVEVVLVDLLVDGSRDFL